MSEYWALWCIGKGVMARPFTIQMLAGIHKWSQNIKVTTTNYKFDTARLINLWIFPVFIFLVIIVLLYSNITKPSQLQFVDIVVGAIMFIYAVGFFIYLFLNHLPLAKQTELAITRQGTVVKQIKIIQGHNIFTTNYNDIKEVIEYSTVKLPWSSIVKWVIITKDNQIMISSLTISQNNFERNFWDKIKQKPHLLPKIKYSSQQGVMLSHEKE